MNYADEAGVETEAAEEGSFSVLPGMNDSEFDYCNCGRGWPMGFHHDRQCPANCICGLHYVGGKTRQTCAYHAGLTNKIPVGPSVMTERWDLKPDLPEGERDGVGQRLDDKSGSEVQSVRAGEEKGGQTPLSHM